MPSCITASLRHRKAEKQDRVGYKIRFWGNSVGCGERMQMYLELQSGLGVWNFGLPFRMHVQRIAGKHIVCVREDEV